MAKMKDLRRQLMNETLIISQVCNPPEKCSLGRWILLFGCSINLRNIYLKGQHFLGISARGHITENTGDDIYLYRKDRQV